MQSLSDAVKLLSILFFSCNIVFVYLHFNAHNAQNNTPKVNHWILGEIANTFLRDLYSHFKWCELIHNNYRVRFACFTSPVCECF